MEYDFASVFFGRVVSIRSVSESNTAADGTTLLAVQRAAPATTAITLPASRQPGRQEHSSIVIFRPLSRARNHHHADRRRHHHGAGIMEAILDGRSARLPHASSLSRLELLGYRSMKYLNRWIVMVASAAFFLPARRPWRSGRRPIIPSPSGEGLAQPGSRASRREPLACH
jgi:hypothetical protein